MSNLFELNENYRKVQEMDLEPDVMINTLNSIKDTRDEKLDNVANWIDQLDRDTDFYDKKIKALREAKTHAKNRRNALMAYMTDVIDDAGLKQVHTEHHILRPRNYRQGVNISNVDKLPEEFIKTKETTAPNKPAIYKALKAGQEVPGAELVANRKTVIK